MNANNLIEKLQKRPELWVKVAESKKHEDNAPTMAVLDCHVAELEDVEEEVLLLWIEPNPDTSILKWEDAVTNPPPPLTVVLGYNEKWIDEDFEPEGIRECFMSDDGEWNSAVWDNDQDNWHNESTWGDKGHPWVGVAPTHWMQRPKAPNVKAGSNAV